MGSLWLLDSGASAHFMHDFNVFIEYKPLPVDKRIPVKTASNMIYVEGIGTVLLKHKQGNKLVTTCLFPVLYIPQSSSRLLSMGEFFQHGLSVRGDKHTIHLTNQSTPLITCLPLGMAQTLYWLDATVSMVKQVSCSHAVQLTGEGNPPRVV